MTSQELWRKKHGFPANMHMDVDIPIVHGATPRRLRRKWQVANFLRCKQLNCHRIAWACHKSIATASDSKEGGYGKTSGKKNRLSIIIEWPSLRKNSRYENGTALKLCRHTLWTFLCCPGPKMILQRTQRKIPSAKLLSPFWVIFRHETLHLETFITF